MAREIFREYAPKTCGGLCANGAIHASLGQRPRKPEEYGQGLKARHIRSRQPQRWSGLSALLPRRAQTWGVAPGWNGCRPLALTRGFLRKHLDHTYSFVDCASFVVMGQLGLREAATTDSHFTEAGFTALLR